MSLDEDNVVAFQRTVWSTTIGSGDEANYATLWSGPAADVVKFKLELHLTLEAITAMQVTPHALLSNDGETWTSVSWIGTAPTAITDQAVHALGPFEIDQFHGKALMRIVLKVEAESGTSLVAGQVRGRLTLFDAEKAELDISGGSYVAGGGLQLVGTTFSVDGTVARVGTTPQFAGLLVNTSSFTYTGASAEVRGGATNGVPPVYIRSTTSQAASRCLGLLLQDAPSSTSDFWIFFQDNAGGNTRGTISGDGGTGIDVNLTSDVNEKVNVRDADIPDARAVVRAIAERDWDPLHADSPKARRGRGYIAQELYTAYPDAVKPGHTITRTDGTTEEVPWQISPMRLIPVLTRALWA